MAMNDRGAPSPPLLLVAGAKGAVASTVAAAVAMLQENPEAVSPSLMTAGFFPRLGRLDAVRLAGWDRQTLTLPESIRAQGIVPAEVWEPCRSRIEAIPLRPAPSSGLGLAGQVEQIGSDIETFKNTFPGAAPVFVNLLPAAVQTDFCRSESLSQLIADVDPERCPDLAYLLAALSCGVPVVNFTPNDLESPPVLSEARKKGVPLAGRDGKTGQTFLKVVLASALKARRLTVEGWYSLNILGNEDGKNLMDPQRAAGKMANKTEVLDEVLGYRVGAKYGAPCHKVHIDYYPPRGDAKEAWDVIDFSGLFGLPMSMRLNLMGRDSILAAPLVIDLARWMAALKLAGFAGPVPELGFYFKKPVGENAPVTFQEQIAAIERLQQACEQAILSTEEASR